MRRATTVWIAPSATRFSCLCEPCLDLARSEGSSFLAAARGANVQGTLDLDALAVTVCCPAGHELVVRRGERPPNLARRDARQLELV